jgi:hypothetical protein
VLPILFRIRPKIENTDHSKSKLDVLLITMQARKRDTNLSRRETNAKLACVVEINVQTAQTHPRHLNPELEETISNAKLLDESTRQTTYIQRQGENVLVLVVGSSTTKKNQRTTKLSFLEQHKRESQN